MVQGPAVSVGKVICPYDLSFTQLFLWCSAQCSPTGALVQLGGVLALHVPHVVLRGPLPIENEQLLGLPITLILLYLKNMSKGPPHFNCLNCLGVCRESINSRLAELEAISVEHIFL